MATIHVIYVLTLILIARSFIKQDRRTALWRAYALGAGFPILEALEHGNLIIPTLALMIIAFGPLVRSTRLRWLAIGLAVNFKVYVIAAIMPQLLRRRWRWVEGALLTTVGVYLATFALLGRGSPIEIYSNITAFASSGASTLLDVWFPATFLALQALLDNWESPMLGILGSRNVEVLLFVLPALQHIVQGAIVIAAAAAWFRPEIVSRYRLTNLGICLALVTTESGGYTVILPFFFTFLEKWEGIWVKWAIVAVYILCIPLDIPVDKAPQTVRDTYMPGATVIATYSIMIGPFIRPLFFYSIPFALSIATILDVWRDARGGGWKPGWRYGRGAPQISSEASTIVPNVHAILGTEKTQGKPG